MTGGGTELRIRQSSLELLRLREDVRLWTERRTTADVQPGGEFRGQYQTQLGRIVDEVNGAADAIEEVLDALQLTTGVGAVYQECGRHDRRIIWLRRAWEFYRDKFDQRDDEGLKACVRAADEVLWSCYKPFFNATGMTLPPAPLPYVENIYSPMAVRPDDSSHLEKSAEIGDGPLKPFFESLPIALLKLPPASVTSAWTHVLIGHEAGHFVQDFVLPGGAYRRVFRERVQALAVGAAGDGAGADWGRWAPEIFADLFAVLLMGPAAVWAVAQFELARPGNLTTHGTDYPSPLVRIYLLDEFAAELGLPGSRRISDELGIDVRGAAAASAKVSKDLLAADAVARIIAEPLPEGLGSWSGLIDAAPSAWTPGKGFDEPGDVLQWAEALQNKRQKQDRKTLECARRVAAGTAQAWRDILAATAGPERDQSVQSVEENAFKRMIACAEPGKRAAPAARAINGNLKRTLLAMGDEELFS